jgi:hypothetical protein
MNKYSIANKSFVDGILRRLQKARYSVLAATRLQVTVLRNYWGKMSP